MKHPDVGRTLPNTDPVIWIRCFFLFSCILLTTSLSGQEKGRDGLVPVASGSGGGVTRAVVVGISDYQHSDIPDLRFAHRDAEVFAGWLQSPEGKNLKTSQLHLLTNRDASAARVFNEIIWLVEESGPNDEAILYFSGHGDVQRVVGQQGYLLCHDASPQLYGAGGAISLQVLKEAIHILTNERQSRVTVIMDACHSGKLKGSLLGGPQINVKNIMSLLDNATKIMACQANEVSLESEQWGGGHGVFSYFLLKGLNGDADQNDDKQITLYEFRRYLEEHILAETSPILQHPIIEGDPERIIANVSTLKNTTDPKSFSIATFYKIEERSYEDLLLGGNDSSLVYLVNKLKYAIENEFFFATDSQSADSLYVNILEHPNLTQKAERYITRYYAASLQDDAQQMILDLLKSETKASTSGYEVLPELYKYPKQLARAAEILGQNHLIYKELKSREFSLLGLIKFFETYQQRDSISANEVMTAYEKSLNWMPESPLALFGMSRCLAVKMNAPDSAIQVVNRLRTITPAWTLPGAKLAYQLSRDYKRFQDAANLIETNLKIDSTCIPTWTALGALYHYLPNITKAIKAFEYLIELDSTNAIAWSNLGVEYLLKGNKVDAERALKNALRLNPKQAMAHHSLGAFYRIENNNSKAKFYYTSALKLSPKRLPTLDSLASLYQLEEDFQSALSICDSILTIQPTYSGALFRKATIYRNLDDHTASSHFLKKAIQTDKKYIKIIENDSKWKTLLDLKNILSNSNIKPENED
ncbi:MAG: caspase family protein [Saprospiraceae bacterium]|nr:caspase family protein [Saprospiraceae bacterium]